MVLFLLSSVIDSGRMRCSSLCRSLLRSGPVRASYNSAYCAVVFTLLSTLDYDLAVGTTEIQRSAVGIIHYASDARLKIDVDLWLLLVDVCLSPRADLLRETQVLIYIFSMYLFFSALQNFAFGLFRGHE